MTIAAVDAGVAHFDPQPVEHRQKHPALHGLRFVALRFLSVWGSGQRPDLALETFRRRIEAGQPVIINGDGSQRSDLTRATYHGLIQILETSRQKLSAGRSGRNMAENWHAPVKVCSPTAKSQQSRF
jgi:hypothetical protein